MTGTEEYLRWLSAPCLTDAERAELEALRDDPQEIRERFYAPLAFGTAGLRGIMGAGIRRMNARVVRQATAALAELILQQGREAAEAGAVVCYDCRNHSREFAGEAARVLAARGIRVRLFRELRPTPELSYAIRLTGATAGINITASHNPKEYNGYKVYWSDGAQLPPDHADRVAAVMETIDVLAEETLPTEAELEAAGLLTYLGEETDEAFLQAALSRCIRPECIREADLSVVYTPFYGAGAVPVMEAFRRLGAGHVLPVEEQMAPNGDFPTAASPNPEYEVGFARALELARSRDAALIIGTDPDSDRIGVMVRTAPGAYTLLSGNQMGVLYLDYLLEAGSRNGTLPRNAVALRSLVSTDMVCAVAEAAGVTVEETFTGFKFLAERMKEYENGEKTVIFAFEEAIGYAFGTAVRDKDGVTAAVMALEMASAYALEGKTLMDRLEELYARFGRYAERTVSVAMPGVDGLERMRQLMQSLRAAPPARIAGRNVACFRDYLSGEIRRPDGAPEKESRLVGSDVLGFELQGGGRLVIRPSGTEPKIKIYLHVREDSKARCEAVLDELEAFCQALTES